MTVIVQVIKVTWTKKSRGNPGASLRNSVSERYPFNFEVGDKPVYLQEIAYSEFDDFSNPIEKGFRSVNDNQLREIGLEFLQENDILKVKFWGVPIKRQYSLLKNIGDLEKNNWLKIIGNVRVSWEYTWAYHKYVYSIFNGVGIKVNEVVKMKAPTIIFNDEIDLF